MKYFRVPETFVLKSGHKYYGEEMLLISLYRLHRPTSITDACFKTLFGRDYKDISRIVNEFVSWLVYNWSYLIEDNMEFWLDSFPEFAEKIRIKVNEKGCTFDENDFCIFGFIDCTVIATARPGGGPVSDGIGSRRNPGNLQRAFYNGWKHHHGVKLQSVSINLFSVIKVYCVINYMSFR
jgi:hypothetical protein